MFERIRRIRSQRLRERRQNTGVYWLLSLFEVLPRASTGSDVGERRLGSTWHPLIAKGVVSLVWLISLLCVLPQRGIAQQEPAATDTAVAVERRDSGPIVRGSPGAGASKVPTSFVVTKGDIAGTINLSWVRPTTTAGLSNFRLMLNITGSDNLGDLYDFWIDNGEDATAATYRFSSTSTSVTSLGFDALSFTGTENLCFKLRAKYSDDSNGDTAEKCLYLPDAGKATPPSISSVTSSSITIGWSRQSQTRINGIIVEVSDDGTSNWTPADTVGTTDDSYTHQVSGGGVQKCFRLILKASLSTATIAANGVPSNHICGTTTTTAPTVGPPGSVTATANSATQVTITWAVPTDITGGATITGYEIEYTTASSTDQNEPDDSNWAVAGTHGTTTPLQFVHSSATDLAANTKYFYRVSATFSGGDGDPSDPVSVTTLNTPTVGAPERVEAQDLGPYSIRVAWTPPTAITGNATIDGYEVQWASSINAPDGDWRPVGVGTGSGTYDANTRNATHSNLDHGTTYHYRVRATFDGTGKGAWGKASDDTDRARLGPPQDFEANAQGHSRIYVTWRPPVAVTGIEVTGYRLQISPDGDWTNTASIVTVDRADTDDRYEDGNLRPLTERHYRICALYEFDGTLQTCDDNPTYSDWSATVDETTEPETAIPTYASPPQNIRPISGDEQITLLWDPPSITGSGIVGYKIEYQPDPEGTVTEINTGNDNTSFVVTGLGVGEEWFFRITSVTSDGVGPEDIDGVSSSSSGLISGTTNGVADDRFGMPTEFSAEPSGNTSIELEWKKPGNVGLVARYEIDYRVSGEATWTRLAFVSASGQPSSFQRYSHRGLSPGTTYEYRIRGFRSLGWRDGDPTGYGEYTPVVEATTTGSSSARAPSMPTNLSATPIGSNQIDLSWTVDDEGTSPVSYEVQLFGDDGRGEIGYHTIATVTTTSYSHTNLEAQKTYYYRVVAFSDDGRSDPSKVVSATTGDVANVRPSAPKDLRAQSRDSSIALAWDAPDTVGRGITGYEVQAARDGGGFSVLSADTESSRTNYVHANPEIGAQYTYRVRAINAAGKGPWSSTITAATTGTANRVPSAPLTLTAELNDAGEVIELDWDRPQTGDVDGYRVSVSDDRGETWDVLADSVTKTEYTHTDAEENVRYDYTVQAYNQHGLSPRSNRANATLVIRRSAPTPPKNLTASLVEDDVRLRWEMPDANGGREITGYTIEVVEDDGGWKVLVEDTESTETRYTHEDITRGVVYSYRVSAINEIGTSRPSNVATVDVESTVPDAPTDLVGVAGRGQIDLTWRAPRQDGGLAIEGYRIELLAAGTEGWQVLVENTRSTETVYVHDDVEGGEVYRYRVSAINSDGVGAPSNVAAVTATATVPDAPAGLTVTPQQLGAVLTWTAPGHDGGAPVTGYRIEVSENQSETWTILVANTNSLATSYSTGELLPGRTYQYRIYAMNRIGLSDASSIATIVTAAQKPDAPTNLVAAAVGSDQIDLSWAAPAEDGGARIIGYLVEAYADGYWQEIETTRTADTEYSHMGLMPATTYEYRVSAINRIGTGDPSEKARATTKATVPEMPLNLRATTGGSDRIDLAWEPPEFDGGAAVSGYRIEYRSEEESTWRLLVGNTGDNLTVYSDRDLEPGMTRYYRVAAINEIGTSAPSDVAYATTDPEAPGSPVRLKATEVTHDRIDLVWEAPETNGGAEIEGYTVEGSDDGQVWTTLADNVTDLMFSHGSLKPASVYRYRVSAFNRVGTGDPSRELAVRTLATVPDAPTNLTVSTQLPDRIELVWDAPEFDGGAEITDHVVRIADADGMAREVRTGSAETAFSHDGLAPGEVWIYSVAAVNEAGVGEASAEVTGMTDDPVGRANRMTEEILPRFASTATASTLSAISERMETVGNQRRSTLGSPDETAGAGSLVNGAKVNRSIGGGISVWGGGDYADMRSSEGSMWNGGMTTVHAGIDVQQLSGPMVAGISTSRSSGTFEFTDRTYGEVAGELKAEQMTVNPYIGWINRWGRAWAAISVGSGEVSVEDDLAELRSSDTRVRTVAVGAAGTVTSNNQGSLAVKADVFSTELNVEGSEGITAASFSMQRIRAILEWSMLHELDDAGGTISMQVGAGVRLDDDSRGYEIAGGTKYSSANSRIVAKGEGRILLGDDSYEEWGVRGLIQLNAVENDYGLSLSVRPSYGSSESGIDRLWEHGMDANGMLARGSVGMEAQYGFRSYAGTPYSRMNMAGGNRTVATGIRYSLTSLELAVEGFRLQNKQGMGVKGMWSF